MVNSKRRAVRKALVKKLIDGAKTHEAMVSSFAKNPRGVRTRVTNSRLTPNQRRYYSESVRMLRANLADTKRFMRKYSPNSIVALFERKYGVNVARELSTDPKLIKQILDSTAHRKGLLMVTSAEFAPKPRIRQTPFGIEFTLTKQSFDKLVGNDREASMETGGFTLGEARQFMSTDGKIIFFSIIPDGVSSETRKHEMAHLEDFATVRQHRNSRIEFSKATEIRDYLRAETFARLKSLPKEQIERELTTYFEHFLEQKHGSFSTKDVSDLNRTPKQINVLLERLPVSTIAEIVKMTPFEKLSRRLTLIQEYYSAKTIKQTKNGIIIPTAEEIRFFLKQ